MHLCYDHSSIFAFAVYKCDLWFSASVTEPVRSFLLHVDGVIKFIFKEVIFVQRSQTGSALERTMSQDDSKKKSLYGSHHKY